jgi:hypothetical protein
VAAERNRIGEVNSKGNQLSKPHAHETSSPSQGGGLDGFPDEATVVLFLPSLRLTEATLTGRDIETRFVRKSGQKQDRRNDGKKENTFKFS